MNPEYAPVRRIANAVSRTVMAKDVFGKYRREEKQTVRQANVKEDAIIKKFKAIWRKLKRTEYSEKDVMKIPNIDEHFYQLVLNAIKDINYTAKDVEKFSISFRGKLGGESSIRAGLFFSALINGGTDSHYIIWIEHLEGRINFLGYRNTKNVTIEGGAVYGLGCEMLDGHIMLKGNAEERAGIRMNGGVIEIFGNTKNFLGSAMHGGKIIVHGTVESNIGLFMEGGEIYIEGEIGGISKDIVGGKIFHKGVLIWPKQVGDTK